MNRNGPAWMPRRIRTSGLADLPVSEKEEQHARFIIRL
jgi:hypothetical protein